MKAFLLSALPLVLAGIALALLAANYHAGKLKDEKFGQHVVIGAGLGLILGVMLNGCGLWENHIWGIILGPLWGMAMGTTPRSCDSGESSHDEQDLPM